jgi:hypothetical protein
MIARVLATAALTAALFQGVAYAANTPSSNSSPNNATQNVQSLPHEIQQRLQHDGFSSVKVVPGSFLVSAKDKNGDPVEMVIRPNSMTMMTEASPNNSPNNESQSGSAGNQSSGTNK